jgi:peptide/nickel transport system ATP-binding protein
MQQRAMIAMGLALEPGCSSPTGRRRSMCDTAQVLKLLREIRDTHGTAIPFITHDLGVMSSCTIRSTSCMRQRVEEGPVDRLRPAGPSLYADAAARRPPAHGAGGAAFIPARSPALQLPAGCRFADRCPHRFSVARANLEPAARSQTRRAWLESWRIAR